MPENERLLNIMMRENMCHHTFRFPVSKDKNKHLHQENKMNKTNYLEGEYTVFVKI